ncbi:MAG: (d)CMP kinase [Candidatus Omnitrophota bacterium]
MGGIVIIAIDGPAGSGKSTVSKLLADRMGLLYVDTGAMYRALTLNAMKQNVSLNDASALIGLAGSTKIDLVSDNGRLSVRLDGCDVTDAIRSLEVSKNVKYVARVAGVRERMARLQRSIARQEGAVLEGRDIGTVVFPDAEFKFYLDASPDVRVERRYKELRDAGRDVRRSEIRKDVQLRDSTDMGRDVGPLKQAEDAVLIDTSDLTIDGVVEKMLSHLREAGSLKE